MQIYESELATKLANFCLLHGCKLGLTGETNPSSFDRIVSTLKMFYGEAEVARLTAVRLVDLKPELKALRLNLIKPRSKHAK